MSFAEDWSQILKLHKELSDIPREPWNWSLRVFLYKDCEGVGSEIFYKGQRETTDSYFSRIDGFFPFFKADLKEYLKDIYSLLKDGKEEEAEDRLVALPKLLKELHCAYNQQ